MSGIRWSVVILLALFCGGAFVQAGVESSGALSGPSFLRVEARQGGGWKTAGLLRLGLRSFTIREEDRRWGAFGRCPSSFRCLCGLHRCVRKREVIFE